MVKIVGTLHLPYLRGSWGWWTWNHTLHLIALWIVHKCMGSPSSRYHDTTSSYSTPNFNGQLTLVEVILRSDGKGENFSIPLFSFWMADWLTDNPHQPIIPFDRAIYPRFRISKIRYRIENGIWIGCVTNGNINEWKCLFKTLYEKVDKVRRQFCLEFNNSRVCSDDMTQSQNGQLKMMVEFIEELLRMEL